MGLGTSHITLTTAANSLPYIWSKETIRTREANLVFGKLVKRVVSDLLKEGQAVYFNKSTANSARTKSANTEVTYDVSTEEKVTISVDTHAYLAQMIEKSVMDQSAVDWESEVRWNIGYAVAKKIDTVIATLAANASVTQTVGTVGTPIVDSQIIAVAQYLDDANAPESDRSLVLNPQGIADLRNIDKYMLRSSVGFDKSDSPVTKPSFNIPLYGISVYSSTNVYAANGTTYNVGFHKDGFALAMQQTIDLRSRYEPGYIGTQFVGDTLFGAGLFRADHVVQVIR